MMWIIWNQGVCWQTTSSIFNYEDASVLIKPLFFLIFTTFLLSYKILAKLKSIIRYCSGSLVKYVKEKKAAQKLFRLCIKSKVQLRSSKQILNSNIYQRFINRDNELLLFLFVVIFSNASFKAYNRIQSIHLLSTLMLAFHAWVDKKNIYFFFLNCFWTLNWIKNHYFGIYRCDDKH